VGTYKYIAVAGNIGCGKSSLVEFICRNYGVEPFYEPNANNPYIKDFYRDMRVWALKSQLYFLTHKFRIHRDLTERQRNATVILDRTIYEDAEVFASYLHARRLISKRDWQLYWSLYETIRETLRPPDLLIYLRASVRTIRKRIRLRGRQEEQDISLTYVRKLNQLYERWFENYQLSPTVIIETDSVDYISNLVDRIDVLRTIESHLTTG